MSYVRNGQIVWPYCQSCNRRLDYSVFKNMVAFTHFHSVPEDACSERFETFWLGLDKVYGDIARIVGLTAY